MPGSDAFAPTDKALDPFLFARIGTEPNGSDLTALSLLARLGSDPWVEAARLASLPRSAATDWLAERIVGQIPVDGAPSEARLTAARLVLLLPERGGPDDTVHGSASRAGPTLTASVMPLPGWTALAIILALITLGFATNASRAPFAAPGPALMGRQ